MKKTQTHKTDLEKVAAQCFADSFVVNQTLVLRINNCKKKPLRQASAVKPTSK